MAIWLTVATRVDISRDPKSVAKKEKRKEGERRTLSSTMDDDDMDVSSSVSSDPSESMSSTPKSPAQVRLRHARFTTTGRVREDVTPPMSDFLPSDAMWDPDGKPNTEVLRKHFKREGRLKKEDLLQLVRTASDVFASEPNLVEVSSPITGL